MSEPIRSISEGTFVIGDTNGLTFESGPGISVSQPSEGTVRIANDETVLWSGNLTIGSTATLSESVKNFELFGVYGHETNRGRGVYQQFNPAIIQNANTQNFALFLPDCASDLSWAGWYIENLHFTDTAATALVNVSGRQTWRWYTNGTWEDGGPERYIQVDKIVGINRIAGGNA